MLTEGTPPSFLLELGSSLKTPVDSSETSLNPNLEETLSSLALYRNLSLDVLANDFLNVFTTEHQGSSDGGAILDARLYFVERVFPTLVIALEKLLIKLQRPSNVCFSMSSSIQQLDHLPVTFNPILWLAQYLFRHAHSIHSSTSTSIYTLQLNEVSKNLKHRLANLQDIRISHLKAEREARRLELEAQRKLKAILLERKRNHIQEKCRGILRKLPKILQLHHPVFYSDMLASCQCILSSSLFKDSAETKTVVQQFHDEIKQKNPSFTSSNSSSNPSLSSSLQPLSNTLTLESMVDLLLPWTDSMLDSLFLSYQSWITLEEDRMAKLDVDSFLNQWKSTGLSLHQALQLSLLTSQDILPETLVEEIQMVIQHKDPIAEPFHLEIFTKIAKTNAKTLADLYPTLISHPEYKEQLCITPTNNLSSAPTISLSDTSLNSPLPTISNTIEKEPLEKPSPNIDLLSSARKEEIQKMITTHCQTWKDEALKTHILNAILSLSSQQLIQRLELSEHLLQNKLPIPLNAYLTHTVASSDFLIDYFTRKWKNLNDADFLAAFNAFKQSSITLFHEHHPSQTSTASLAKDIKGDSSASSLSTSSSSNAHPTPSPSPLVSPDYATACLNTLTPLIETFPPQVRIHVAFKNSTIAESSTDTNGKSFQGFTVLSSNDPQAIGTKLKGELFETLLSSKVASSSDAFSMELPQPQLVTEIQPGEIEAWNPSTSSDILGYAVMMPIQTSSGIVGMIYVDALQHVAVTKTYTTTQELHFFLKSHVEKLYEASQSLGTQLELVDKFNQMMIVAQSSISYLREQVQADPHFYLVQNDELYSITFQDPGMVSMSSSSSALWQKLSTSHALALLTHSSSTDYLYECAKTQTTLTKDQETAVPILDPVTQQPIAVMVMASSSTQESLEKEDIEQVQKIAKVLGTALSTATKKKPLRKLGLAAESLDDQGELIFVTCMLDSLRESIRELDSSAIAELKSYKKPPPTIHKVLKCLCYLFGKTPKQVKLWSDTIKYINMEMLKQMLNYDPTAIQKKSIFIRIRKILKTIPHGDVRKKGSLPALTVYAWLLINLDLRDKALQARRRASIRNGIMDDAALQEEPVEMEEAIEEDPLEGEEEIET